jgi:glutathione synthase/RimK-type ligase-like ATP-grasp enzyme
MQELIPPRSNDLRVIVSGGEVVGAAVRIAAPGEWRTNVSLGGRSIATKPPRDACDLAVAAAQKLTLDLAGVDLLRADDGWIVLEVNAAVDMKPHYSLETDVFAAALEGLRVGPVPVL